MKYGSGRHKPTGDWVIATPQVKVAGVHYRKGNAEAFALATYRAEKAGLEYGLQLEHQPNHPNDSNAIAVMGVAQTAKGVFRKTLAVHEWHIGFVPAYLAAEIVEEFISKGVPIAAELCNVYESENGFLDFNFFILAPPGNSMSSRMRKKRR